VAAVQSRYGGQTNTILLTNVICSYTASHRSHSEVTQHGRIYFCNGAGSDPFAEYTAGLRKRW
jgi:hypothetical protein